MSTTLHLYFQTRRTDGDAEGPQDRTARLSCGAGRGLRRRAGDAHLSLFLGFFYALPALRSFGEFIGNALHLAFRWPPDLRWSGRFSRSAFTR